MADTIKNVPIYYSIRRMKEEDKDFIRGMAPRFAEFGIPPWRDQQKGMAFHRHDMEATIQFEGEDSAVFVAIDESGSHLGFIHVHAQIDFLTDEKQGYVSTFGLREGTEGNGIGKALLNTAEEWARSKELRLLTLSVFAANKKARVFYAKNGFQEELLKLAKNLA